jgi:hypothetical protein
MLYYIYCIWVKTENGVLRYYGHTENMTVRKGVHVAKHKAWVKAGKPEKVSEVNGTRSVFVLDHEDWRMDVVDKIECNTKDEARTLEGEWILENDCVNMCVAGRIKKDTDKQYRHDHKEQIKEIKRQHYEENKAKIKEKQKKYREQNKEYLKQYRETHKKELNEYKKQYQEDHKEEQKEYKKQYYEQNKEKISEKEKVKVTCEVCGSVVRKKELARHQKTKKCAKISQPIITNADALSPNP